MVYYIGKHKGNGNLTVKSDEYYGDTNKTL